MQSDVVGCMDECNMMVVILKDSRCALTATFMPHMPSLTQILLVNFVCSLECTFSLIWKRQDDNWVINRQSTRFSVWNICMAHMTVAHAQKNYCVSQSGH